RRRGLARGRTGAGPTGDQFDRTHRGARRVEAVGNQYPAIEQGALRVPSAVADHRRASAEGTAVNSEDMGGVSGNTHGVRAVGDQQLASIEGPNESRDAAVVAEPGSARRAEVGPTVRHRVVAQERIRRRERGYNHPAVNVDASRV